MAHWRDDSYDNRWREEHRYPPGPPQRHLLRDWEERRVRYDRPSPSPRRSLLWNDYQESTIANDKRQSSPARRDYRRDWEERRLSNDRRPSSPALRDYWYNRQERRGLDDRRELSPPRFNLRHCPRAGSPRAPWEQSRSLHARRPSSPPPREPNNLWEQRRSLHEQRSPSHLPYDERRAWGLRQSRSTHTPSIPPMNSAFCWERRIEAYDQYPDRHPPPLTSMQNRREQQPLPHPGQRYLQVQQQPSMLQRQPHFPPSPDTWFMTGGHHMVLQVPKPTAEYESKARTDEGRYELDPSPLLLILDLNGTLIHRPKKGDPTQFVSRPLLDEFLEHVFSHYKVMIWSSARPENVRRIVKKLLSPEQHKKLVAIWDRQSLRLSPMQYQQKMAVYKQLSWVWAMEEIQTKHPRYRDGGRWSQSNTLMVDDSVLKASAEPYNHIAVPEFTGARSDAKLGGRAVLEQVAGYLHTLQHASNVCWFVRTHPFKISDSGAWHGLSKSSNGKETESGVDHHGAEREKAEANGKRRILESRDADPEH